MVDHHAMIVHPSQVGSSHIGAKQELCRGLLLLFNALACALQQTNYLTHTDINKNSNVTLSYGLPR